MHLTHERFLREARSAAAPAIDICAIFDAGEQDGRPYLVMELLHGETLKQYLAKAGRPLRPHEVIAFSKQSASALAAAHSKGIVHRDIKPAKSVRERNGTRPAADQDSGFWAGQEAGRGGLGVTRPFTADATATVEASPALDLTSPGSTIGTVAEDVSGTGEGLPLDARTDLFSLASASSRPTL